jgi:hypothetical protein
LQIAVGAASRRLYLSYPRLEVAEGRARVPSFYALDVARSITGHVPDYEVLAREAELAGASRLARPAPRDSSEAIDDAEYDLATVWPLLKQQQPPENSLTCSEYRPRLSTTGPGRTLLIRFPISELVQRRVLLGHFGDGRAVRRERIVL